jgi:hypothetical protein
MTDQASAGRDWVPEGCTLPTSERPLRLAEFDALFTAAVRGGERLGVQHLRVTLEGGADVADSVRNLAARESDCCSFFAFTVTVPDPGFVQLDIEVPAGHVDVLDALQRRAITVRGQR